MFSRKPIVRNLRKLVFQSLEDRNLMAANVTASLSGTALVIEGTEGNDNIVVTHDLRYGTAVYSSDRLIASFPNSYTSIQSRMLGGSDRFKLNAYNNNQLNQVAVNMGRGSSETVQMNIGSVGRLVIDAKDAVGTFVSLNVNVRDSAIIDFGNDTGRDTLETGVVGRTASFNNLFVNMGDGSDRLDMRRTSVQSVQVNMGDAADSITLDRDSYVTSGSFDGSSGRDDYFTKLGASLKGIRILNTEVVRNGR
jgi:hypothetical protein